MAAGDTISLSLIRAVGAGRVLATPEGVCLETSAERWEFAAQAEFDLPGEPDRGRVIRARLAVEAGVIGLGWMVHDQWIARASADSAAAETELELRLPPGSAGGRLIFDNWSEGGQKARVAVRGLEVTVDDERAQARLAIQNLFAGRYVPTGQVEEVRRHLRLFASFDEIGPVVGSNPVMRNFALNNWEFVHGKTVLESYPWNVAIPVADVCNARCVFCTSWLDGRKLLDLNDLALFEPMLRHAAMIGLVGLGEPLAHPQFGELCDRLAEMCDPLAVLYTITNGVFLKKWRDRLDRVNLQAFSVSLNAATPETHDEVMGLGRDALPQIIESLADLTARGGRNVHISLVVTRQNLAEIPAFVELGNRLGVSEIRLRSLTPQPRLLEGLNYHLLPPYLHPDFERLRAAAVDAIRVSAVPVQADPAIWGQRVFPEAVEQQITQNQPVVVRREEALRDRDLRHRAEYLYHQERGIFRGQPLADGTTTQAAWTRGRLQIVTPTAAGAFAVEVPVARPTGHEARLRVEIEASCEAGRLGVGLLDKDAGEWLDRADVEPGMATVELKATARGQPIHLVVLNGGDGTVAARGSIDAVRAETGDTKAVDWAQMTVHNPIDRMDDGSNPLGREPRFACQAVYSGFYVDKFFYRLVPCCFMTHVPGFQEVRLDGGIPFMEAWNSPAFVELRRRLVHGPLYGACRRCPEKW